MRSFIAISMLVILTAGCAIRGPGIRLAPVGVEIGHDGGTHCPPGQAKKGRC